MLLLYKPWSLIKRSVRSTFVFPDTASRWSWFEGQLLVGVLRFGMWPETTWPVCDNFSACTTSMNYFVSLKVSCFCWHPTWEFGSCKSKQYSSWFSQQGRWSFLILSMFQYLKYTIHIFANRSLWSTRKLL